MKISTLVLFTATLLLVILQTRSTQAREFDEFEQERRAGGATDWDREENVDKDRLLQTLLQRAAGTGSGLFSEEKRGSSKAIDHMLDNLNLAMWCRRMSKHNVKCK